ncbi:MAG: methionine biosynthesis protein MetW [Arachnia sp.]
MTVRPDLELIAQLVAPESRVLDLGCGDGWLLRRLRRTQCSGTGVEIDPEPFRNALRAGVDVVDLDINSQLDEFRDDSYDVVVLSRTLQNVQKPRHVLQHMARIAQRSIVSMPNFAQLSNRLRLLRGRMPMSKDLPFAWYDTPNVHYTSLVDLEPLFGDLDLVVEQRIPLNGRGDRHWAGDRLPNLLAGSAVYVLRAERGPDAPH